MQPGSPTGQEISRRLHEALAQLHKDMWRVEVWASALSGFVQPIPDYEPMNDNLLSGVKATPPADEPVPDRRSRDRSRL
jgi:hypothetical protein